MTDEECHALGAMIREEITDSNFIAMVKLARELSNGTWGLPDAKSFVERIQREKFGGAAA